MAMANGVRTATNVVTPPSPYGPSGHYAETQQASPFGIFPKNLQELINSTTDVVLAPKVDSTWTPSGFLALLMGWMFCPFLPPQPKPGPYFTAFGTLEQWG